MEGSGETEVDKSVGEQGTGDDREGVAESALRGKEAINKAADWKGSDDKDNIGEQGGAVDVRASQAALRDGGEEGTPEGGDKKAARER